MNYDLIDVFLSWMLPNNVAQRVRAFTKHFSVKYFKNNKPILILTYFDPQIIDKCSYHLQVWSLLAHVLFSPLLPTLSYQWVNSRLDEFQFLKLFHTHKLITTLSCRIRDGAKPIES